MGRGSGVCGCCGGDFHGGAGGEQFRVGAVFGLGEADSEVLCWDVGGEVGGEEEGC